MSKRKKLNVIGISRRGKSSEIKYWLPANDRELRKFRQKHGSTGYYDKIRFGYIDHRDRPSTTIHRVSKAKYAGRSPAISPSKAHHYSRKYHALKNAPFFRHDPWKYKDRPPPSSEVSDGYEKDEIFHDGEHHTRDQEQKEFAERHMPGAIDTLTLPQRGVYLRREEKGMTMQEIAEELGISRQAAYQRYDRADKRIKEYLKKISRKR